MSNLVCKRFRFSESCRVARRRYSDRGFCRDLILHHTGLPARAGRSLSVNRCVLCFRRRGAKCGARSSDLRRSGSSRRIVSLSPFVIRGPACGVGRLVDFQPEPTRFLADPMANFRSVLADARGEHENIKPTRWHHRQYRRARGQGGSASGATLGSDAAEVEITRTMTRISPKDMALSPL
jgi:hypothetical protein